MNDPALLELFTCLRKAGFSLGLAEYHLLLQAMNAGFGTRDRDTLAQLCRAIWVKSQREEQVFKDYFDQIILDQPQQIFSPSKLEDTSFSHNYNEQPLSQNSKVPRIRNFLILGLTTCAVLVGFAFFLKHPIGLIPKSDNELQFSGVGPFSSNFTADITEKVAVLKIIRTGTGHGAVSAKLNFGKECLREGSNDTSTVIATSIISTDSQVVQFADGDMEEKQVKIPILSHEKADFFQETIVCCLTNPQGEIKLGDRKEALLFIQNKDYNLLILEILEQVLIIASCIILLLVFWRSWKIRRNLAAGDEALVPEAYTNLPKTMLSPEVIRTMTDSAQVAQTTRQSDNPLSELFPLIVNELPVTHRQMKQGWRYLRQFSREGPPTELDLEATIQQVAQQGILLNPVLVPRRINRIELLLLIDRDGSMVPFHHLAQELVETASRGGRFSRVRVYYFHNCPNESLYRDPYHLEAEPIDDCLVNLLQARTVCLIFSDAGAARGEFNSKRRRLTKFFLKELGQHVRYTAWLNPVPRKRWENTTAHGISALVPMFEVNRQDFYRAIAALRGLRQPLEEVLR